MDEYLLSYDSWKLASPESNCSHEELDEERYCLDCGEYISYNPDEEYNYQDVIND